MLTFLIIIIMIIGLEIIKYGYDGANEIFIYSIVNQLQKIFV